MKYFIMENATTYLYAFAASETITFLIMIVLAIAYKSLPTLNMIMGALLSGIIISLPTFALLKATDHRGTSR